ARGFESHPLRIPSLRSGLRLGWDVAFGRPSFRPGLFGFARLRNYLARLISRPVKYPSVPGPIQRATPPEESPSLRSFTIRQGWLAPWTYRRAFVPSTVTR